MKVVISDSHCCRGELQTSRTLHNKKQAKEDHVQVKKWSCLKGKTQNLKCPWMKRKTHMGTLKATWLYGHGGCTDTRRFPLSIKVWPSLQVSSGYWMEHVQQRPPSSLSSCYHQPYPHHEHSRHIHSLPRIIKHSHGDRSFSCHFLIISHAGTILFCNVKKSHL